MKNPDVSDKIDDMRVQNSADSPPSIYRTPGLDLDAREVLMSSSLLNDLDPHLRLKLLKMGGVRSLHKGEFLFMEGDKVTSIYCLLSGTLSEYYTSESGSACLRGIQSPGGCISLPMLFNSEPCHSYYCEALKPSVLFAWDIAEFRKLALQESALGLRVASVLSGYFENSCRLNCICRKPLASSRVAEYLLRRCECMSRQSSISGRCRCAMQADLRPLGMAARDICLSRETLSKNLSALQKKNIIRMCNGVAEILDIEELKRISG